MFSDWSPGITETEYIGGNSEGIPGLNRLTMNSLTHEGGLVRSFIENQSSGLRTFAMHVANSSSRNFAGKVLPFVSIKVAMRVKCNGGATNTFSPPGAYIKIKGPVDLAAGSEKKMCGYMAGVRRMSSTTLQFQILHGSGATGVAANTVQTFGSTFAHDTVLRLRFDVLGLGASGDQLNFYQSTTGADSEDWGLIGSVTLASTSPYYIPWADGMTNGLCGSHAATSGTNAETHFSNFNIRTGTRG